ncbi:IclR family transcriptional regulator [Rhodococcus erythropolis]
MSETPDVPTSNRTPGTQTLARGLEALRLVATTPGGLTIQDIAESLDVHRTIASRLLSTLADFRLVARGPDGRYRAGGGIAALSRELYSGLRDASTPLMRKLANALGGTIAIFVGEEDDAVAVAVVEPANARYWVSFRQGGRHPIDRGAAGYALLAARPFQQGESETVTAARMDGYVISYGEVEPGYWGLGVPLDRPADEPPACVVLISASEELVGRVVPDMLDAAAELSKYNG